MAEGRVCPKCFSTCPVSAQRCSCGHEFSPYPVRPSGPSGLHGSPVDTSRLIGIGCIWLSIVLAILGLMIVMKPDWPGVLDPVGLGQMCGGYLPAVVALVVGVYLLRRPR